MMEGAGLVHILAVSGIHISLMALSCTKFLEVFRLPKRYIKILVLLSVWGYVALAQFSPSAVRAGIMASIASLGWLLQRDSDNLCALAAAAMGIVAVSPFALYSVSFQLSFVVTLGIILCTSPLSFMLQQTKIMSFLLGRFGKRMERFWMGVCSTWQRQQLQPYLPCRLCCGISTTPQFGEFLAHCLLYGQFPP